MSFENKNINDFPDFYLEQFDKCKYELYELLHELGKKHNGNILLEVLLHIFMKASFTTTNKDEWQALADALCENIQKNTKINLERLK